MTGAMRTLPVIKRCTKGLQAYNVIEGTKGLQAYNVIEGKDSDVRMMFHDDENPPWLFLSYCIGKLNQDGMMMAPISQKNKSSGKIYKGKPPP